MGLSDGRGEINDRYVEIASRLAAEISPDIKFPSGLSESHVAQRQQLTQWGAQIVRALDARGIDLSQIETGLQIERGEQ
jgi:hypothetical protein